MSALSALEAEIARVLAEDANMQDAFGDPVRLVAQDARRVSFPFLRIARHEVRPAEPVSDGPIEHRITLEVFSRSGGRETALSLLGVIETALRAANLAPDGYRLVLFYPVYSDVFLRPDGTSFRGLLRLRALSEPVV